MTLYKPTNDFKWAVNDVVDPTTGANNKTPVTTALKNDGFIPAFKIPPRDEFNGALNEIGEWIQFLKTNLFMLRERVPLDINGNTGPDIYLDYHRISLEIVHIFINTFNFDPTEYNPINIDPAGGGDWPDALQFDKQHTFIVQTQNKTPTGQSPGASYLSIPSGSSPTWTIRPLVPEVATGILGIFGVMHVACRLTDTEYFPVAP